MHSRIECCLLLLHFLFIEVRIAKLVQICTEFCADNKKRMEYLCFPNISVGSIEQKFLPWCIVQGACAADINTYQISND
jgi:uncharacterized protein CbrC (UPF0167 family)